MLVLRRKREESIRISADIVVTVLATRGKSVSLGVEAPMEIHVLRSELTTVVARPSNRMAQTKSPIAAEITVPPLI